MTEDLQILILAAGKGVRMRSELPKVLHRICGRSLLEVVLRASAGLSPKKITVVLGYERELVLEEIKRLQSKSFLTGITVTTVIQKEQLGTGHAAQVALQEDKNTLPLVLIVPGDSPLLTTEVLKPLVLKHQQTGCKLSFLTSEPQTPFGMGRILRDGKGKVSAIVEEKDCTEAERLIREVNASLYFAETSFLKNALGALNTNNAQHELYLTDIVSYAVKNGVSVEAMKTENPLLVSGANSRAELSFLEKYKREQINASWMERGVSFENAECAYIDEDVTIGVDTFIGSGTRLRGETTIGSQVQIDGESLIVNTTIGEKSHIKLSCTVDSSEIGPECDIGPFANLRPGTKLVRKVKIGNFVEVKKSVLNSGSKANHLSYIGDSILGEEVNVGAGTITCNYDGVNKYQTTIEKGAFIGSNTSLVAPVTIGEGAVTGAGSVITKDVPAYALAIERSDQKSIEGWAKKRKDKKKR